MKEVYCIGKKIFDDEAECQAYLGKKFNKPLKDFVPLSGVLESVIKQEKGLQKLLEKNNVQIYFYSINSYKEIDSMILCLCRHQNFREHYEFSISINTTYNQFLNIVKDKINYVKNIKGIYDVKYQAKDGTLFESKFQCEIYEESLENESK